MRIAPRRFLWLAGTSIFLVTLASPLAAPGVTLENSSTHPKCSQPLCSVEAFGGILSYDGDTKRCLIGGSGCDLHNQ
jgi:hypothetical protein